MSEHWKDIARGVLLIPAFFLLACAVLLIGLGLYLWLWEPQRLATSVYSEKVQTLVRPQPAQVSPAQTNLLIMPLTSGVDYLTAVTICKVWSRGTAFSSGGAAAADQLRHAWRIWLLCLVILISARLLRVRSSAAPAAAQKAGPDT